MLDRLYHCLLDIERHALSPEAKHKRSWTKRFSESLPHATNTDLSPMKKTWSLCLLSSNMRVFTLCLKSMPISYDCLNLHTPSPLLALVTVPHHHCQLLTLPPTCLSTILSVTYGWELGFCILEVPSCSCLLHWPWACVILANINIPPELYPSEPISLYALDHLAVFITVCITAPYYLRGAKLDLFVLYSWELFPCLCP